MPTTLLAVAVAVLAFVAVFAGGIALSGGLSAIERRIQGLRREAAPGRSVRERLAFAGSLFRRIGKFVPRSPGELGRIERKLMQAGFRRPESVFVLHGAQLILAISFLLAFVAAGRLQGNPLLYGVLSVLLGAALPDVWLARRIAKRQENIQLALPDALDLQVVAVEAGLALDQALMRISEELRSAHPDLCEELRLYNLEVNAGKSRVEALRNLGSRTDVPDLRALVAVLIQTDRFGTSIADSLRVFSDSLRTKRRQRAEEAAAKLPVKMVLPLFLFILPATIVVVLGPAMISISRELFPFLASAR
jgi:tight adherence protein C